MPLTDVEQLALTKVLDFKLSLTRKNTPKLQPLSLYSSELKSTQQIVNSLRGIRDNGVLSDNAVTRSRYFNSLHNQGLVDGSAENPAITSLADAYLKHQLTPADAPAFWQGTGGDEAEYEVVSELASRLAGGFPVSDPFKEAWYGAQTFFDYVPEGEIDKVLSDSSKLLLLFQINSNGWEIGRYFRLNAEERQEFEGAFAKVQVTDKQQPVAPIEVAASKYKDAASQIQIDVRNRIRGFLNAYKRLRLVLRQTLPRLDRQLTLRSGGENSSTLIPKSPSLASLQHPHQLIVTGCPGSGKSYYLDRLTQAADHVIRTQFHPESSFFDFVGAFKPQPVYEQIDELNALQEADGAPGSRGKPFIDYRYVPGPLMRGLLRALRCPNETVVVLIEEINRGNAAAILGDVLQLLDRDESGASRYEIEATPEQRAFFASYQLEIATIRLPANLYLWATMNSADQGVFPLDTAFRRRWSYVYKGYTEPCLYPANISVVRYGGRDYDWDVFRAAINEFLIGLGIHEDKLIGPYFLTEKQLASPDAVLEKLFLYLWDDVLRFRQESLFLAKSFSQSQRSGLVALVRR
ncbi:AAA family ATPase [Pseudomonas sp. SST3]|uniref:AAA family ATPase n=1 Tax=Pseudomonas sp. SST3 TaxID=2267882 RepID=UPI000E0894FF|nr:AAA family ATPase [Pseudomonas sp. SST3]NKQ09402.1 AAA domain-containing protein [Pseudomonas sp. SST3]